MTMNGNDRESKGFCESCHLGSLEACRATYARWHNEQFVVASGVPAWRCDFCGDTYYDSEALTRLILLLGSEADSEVERQWRATSLEEARVQGFGERRRVG